MPGLERLLGEAERLSPGGRDQLVYAIRQNIRFLTRREALQAGREWIDPFAPTVSPPRPVGMSPPAMSLRAKLVVAASIMVVAAAVAGTVVAAHLPGHVSHWITCASGGPEGNPSWSPDGKRLAFTKDGGCGSQVWIVNADGSGLHRLTDGHADAWPSWSPDGRTIDSTAKTRLPGRSRVNAPRAPNEMRNLMPKISRASSPDRCS